MNDRAHAIGAWRLQEFNKGAVGCSSDNDFHTFFSSLHFLNARIGLIYDLFTIAFLHRYHSI
jgi:hypothetical protein